MKGVDDFLDPSNSLEFGSIREILGHVKVIVLQDGAKVFLQEPVDLPRGRRVLLSLYLALVANRRVTLHKRYIYSLTKSAW